MQDEDDIVVPQKCFVCQCKGSILRRTVVTDTGRLEKTLNKMQMCRNHRCYRYYGEIPRNWIHDTVEEYERINNTNNRGALFNPRRYRRGHESKSNTKGTAYKGAAVDTEGTGISAVEGKSTSSIYGRYKRAPRTDNIRVHDGNKRKAAHNNKIDPGENEPNDLLGK